ncbi:MAG: NAD(P) transhydrogenase subunit alpha [Cyclobacteriaceae bacterium]|nr:NAD(P) transhydrogenase subunit alpha [Cyclobacteriaceae bacterium]
MIEIILNNLDLLYFLALCLFLGIEVISNVPSILHTPLMSGANAISGVILVGAILLMIKVDPKDYLSLTIGGIAVLLGTLNIAGGFFVTNRMLGMFSQRKSDKK